MALKSKEKHPQVDYKKLFESSSDHEIIEVLKKRKHYQEEAAKAAINEAIKRELIYSEQDLFSEKYRVEPLKFSLFPEIENTTSRKKIKKSMTRSLIFFGTIMVAWGAWEIFRHNVTEGAGFILAGIVWNLISFSFFKSVKPHRVNVLFIIQAIASVYAVIKLYNYKDLIYMDVFVVVVLFGLVLYGLIYIKKLKD